MLVRVTLKGLMVDPVSKMPIVLLFDEKTERVLPIWIGVFEANAIAIELEQIKTPRPMTHDLLRNFISALGAAVTKISITDLAESTYYALVTLRLPGASEVEVDARPSDAIALALRAKAPIYVEESVLQHSEGAALGAAGGEDRGDRIRKWLEGLDPDELGKYEM